MTVDNVYDFFTWLGVISLAVGVVCACAIAITGNIRDAKLRRDLASQVTATAQAREATESIRFENLKLEAKIQPRRLSKDQLSALANALEQFKGHKIRIESYALDAEGEVFAGQIRDGLKSIFTVDNWVGLEDADNGFVQGISITGDNSALVAALAEALKKQGLVGVTTSPPPPPRVVTLAASRSREKAKDVAAVILVGIKPIEQ